MAEYMASPDSHTALIVQIEDAQAAANAEELLSVPGIDAAFVGPNDIAFSMLKPGERIKADATQWTTFARTPEVLELCASVMKAARKAAIPFGTTTGSWQEAQDWLKRGANFATFGSDFHFIKTGAGHLRRTVPTEEKF